MLRTSLLPSRARLTSLLRPSIRARQLPSNTPTCQSFSRTPFARCRMASPISLPSRRTFTFSSHPAPSLSKSSGASKSLFQRIRHQTRRFLNTSRRRRQDTKTSNPNSKSNLNTPPKPEPEPQTLGAKMRKLSREYGWSALGVYLALSALDFPFCYMLVRYLGTERIGQWEHAITSTIASIIPEAVQNTWQDWRKAMKQSELETTGTQEISESVEMAGWGVEEADQKNKTDASLATQLALAYAIHKSFIFVRVPLTAAVTPKVVRILRSWGWDIGKRTTKEAKALRRASLPPGKKRRRWIKKKGGHAGGDSH